MKKQTAEAMVRGHVKVTVELEVALGHMSLEDALVKLKALTAHEVLENYSDHSVNDSEIRPYGLWQELA